LIKPFNFVSFIYLKTIRTDIFFSYSIVFLTQGTYSSLSVFNIKEFKLIFFNYVECAYSSFSLFFIYLYLGFPLIDEII